jgi:hypothetical protein
MNRCASEFGVVVPGLPSPQSSPRGRGDEKPTPESSRREREAALRRRKTMAYTPVESVHCKVYHVGLILVILYCTRHHPAHRWPVGVTCWQGMNDDPCSNQAALLLEPTWVAPKK